MENLVIPAILVLGIIAAAIITRWINWFTWGQNQYKKDVAHKRREARGESKDKKPNGGEDA